MKEVDKHKYIKNADKQTPKQRVYSFFRALFPGLLLYQNAAIHNWDYKDRNITLPLRPC